jgi:hypothetical protein
MNAHQGDADDLVQYADDAYEAIRALNHRTWRAIPAPLAYGLLGNLNNLGYGLEQLFLQLSHGLARSLTEYDVYDHNRDPAESVRVANKAMWTAARYAHEIGVLLSTAQTAINQQGYNPPDDTDDCEGSDHDDEADKDDDGCQGHPAGPFDSMGVTVYCDGTCQQ